jgi:hypothetical protein
MKANIRAKVEHHGATLNLFIIVDALKNSVLPFPR